MNRNAVYFLTLFVLLAACTPAAASFPTVTPLPQTRLPAVPTATSGPQATATAPVILKIMPLGDSITVGETDINYGGYRNLLGTLLAEDGYIIDFVGSQRSPQIVISDPDHEGHSGWSIPNLQNGIDSEGWLETYQPDIILLHIGSNDIRHGHLSDAPGNLSALLDDILARLPETYIIVAQIIPFSSGSTRGHNIINDAIPGIVASKGPRVSMADMQNILTPGDYVDSYHLNAGGYDKMARAWESAICVVELIH